MLLLWTSLAILISVCECANSGDAWEYIGVAHGPVHWGDDYPECDGSRQSPVDIVATKVHNFPPFEFSSWDRKYNITLTNNGHTVMANIPKETAIVGKGGLDGTYAAAQFHFHWGVNSDIGSEHQIDGRRFPLELHIVTHRQTYTGINDALHHEDKQGLAVLGVMFQISKTNNTNFAPIIRHLQDVHNISSGTEIVGFSLDDILPVEVREGPFFRYEGSLTTPPCSEKVMWTMFSNPIKVSEDQMAEFRLLHDIHDASIHDNWRPHQELYGRTIYASNSGIARYLQQGLADDGEGSASTLISSLFLFITTTLVILSRC